MTVVRAAVTAIGALTAAGEGHRPLWDDVCAGTCRAAPRSLPAPPGLPAAEPVHLAALPPPAAEKYLGRRGLRVLSRESTALAVAAALACCEGGLPHGPDRDDPGTGVAAGTTSAGLDAYVELFAARLSDGVRGVNPALGPQTGLNAPAATVSIFLGAAGPNLTFASGRAAALDALGAGLRAVRSGECAVMLAGGVQTLGHAELTAARTGDPSFGTVSVARPFDRDRAGAVPGEAAVVLALEEVDHATRRGAVPLAEMLGAGSAAADDGAANGSAADGGTADGGADAARRAVEAALAEAGAGPEEVDAVFVSACGDRGVDAAEAHALHALWPDGGVPVCAVSGVLGDCAGAQGAVQTAAAVVALRHGVVPGTAGVRTVDPALPRLALDSVARRRRLRRVLVLAVDAGGVAGALLLGEGRAAGPPGVAAVGRSSANRPPEERTP